ncbi:hypothetical protein HNP40_001935 [Mycobacteroides chelonae]|nr:hypothetical protein [Mycobacteroides chelonae]
MSGYSLGLDSPAAHEFLARQFAIMDVVLDWNKAMRLPPESGSELDSLNRLETDVPVTLVESVMWAITSAYEAVKYLRTLQTVIEEGRGISEPVTRSVIRTALLGGARAAFVLAPTSRAKREENARIVLGQEAKSKARLVKRARNFVALQGYVPSESTVENAVRAMNRLNALGEGQILERVAETFGTAVQERHPEADKAVLTESVIQVWNTYSGAAHAYFWPQQVPGDLVTDLGMVMPIVQLGFDVTRSGTRA